MVGIVSPMISSPIVDRILNINRDNTVDDNTSSGYSGIANTDNIQEALKQFGLSAAEEQEKNRVYNAEQAALARDWYADMSNSAYQRAVSDMRAAGLNPALMFGSGQAAATAAGSAASYSVNPGDTAARVINSFASYGKYYSSMISAISGAVNGLLDNVAKFLPTRGIGGRSR